MTNEQSRAHATTLAALRLYQRNSGPWRDKDPIATNWGAVKPLTDTEIDYLCESLNVGVAPAYREVMPVWPDIRLAVALYAIADAEEALGMGECTCRYDQSEGPYPCPKCFGEAAATRAMNVFEAAR